MLRGALSQAFPRFQYCCTVKGGKLCLHQEEYQVLVLPPMSTIRRSDAKRLLELAQTGVLIVAVGAFYPTASAEAGAQDTRLMEILQQLESRLLRVYATWKLPAALSQKIDLDIQVIRGDSLCLDAAHRWREGVDFYLLSNTSPKEESFTVSVRKQAPYVGFVGSYRPRSSHLLGSNWKTYDRFIYGPAGNAVLSGSVQRFPACLKGHPPHR